MTDPNFPDRPDHPDFWKLSEAVIANDAEADNGQTVDDLLAKLGIESGDSVIYMSRQRMLRLFRHNFMSVQTSATIGSLYVDGFALGLRVARNEETTLADRIDQALDDFRAGKGDPLAALEEIAEELR